MIFAAMESGYSTTVLDHFEHPRNAGEMQDPDAVGYQTNPVCGDTMRLMLRISDSTIRQAMFQTSGCPASIAASSICTEMITGRRLEEVRDLRKEDIAEALGGLPASKVHCSVLAADALRKAIADYEQRQPASGARI